MSALRWMKSLKCGMPTEEILFPIESLPLGPSVYFLRLFSNDPLDCAIPSCISGQIFSPEIVAMETFVVAGSCELNLTVDRC